MTDWVRDRLEKLTLEEKAMLVAGQDLWHTVAIPRAGVPTLKVTDGPRGARGADGNHGPTSTSFPVGVAMGASWDPALIQEVGVALAHETRAKGAHVLLGPTVNIPRVPNAGRNFECFSEDPLLSGVLAAAWISGLQSQGVAACIKHFVCNDQETDRYDVDVMIDDRALRELYLEPFRIAVSEAAPWSAMSAYNSINGTSASEHPMIDSVLREEFGFDGAVLSDWYGTYSPDVLSSGLDLEMPGPGRWLSAEAVLAGLGDGTLTEADLDSSVQRLLTLMERSGAGEWSSLAEQADERPSERLLARRLAVDSTVLLTNNGLLPLSDSGRVAVIGELAADTPHQGGGSSSVNAHHVVSVLEGIESAVSPTTDVVWSKGCAVRRGAPPIEPADLADGSLHVEYFSNPTLFGEPVRSVDSQRSFLSFFGTADEWIDYDAFSVRVSGRLVARRSGDHVLHVTAGGRARARIDDQDVIDAWDGGEGESWTAELRLDSGEEVDVVVEYSSLPGERWRWLGLGWTTPGSEPSLEDAVSTAAAADVAVVVAGLGPDWESEGFDRPDLRLPGSQDELIAAVANVQPNTVVVLVSGAPVEMPWVNDVSAVLEAWYGGQEVGHAVADVLLGAEPGGRLPVVFPLDSTQHPGLLNFPGDDGRLRYGEGVHVGQRAFDKLGLQPLFPMGHGLSYTTFSAVVADHGTTSAGVSLDVEVTNTGQRSGSEVLQVYAHDVGGVVRRLVDFTKVTLAPAEVRPVRLDLPWERFRTWNPAEAGWSDPAGQIRLSVRGTFGDLQVPPIEIES